MNWKRIKLKKIANITSSKRIYMNEYVTEGIPFYRSKEIIDLFNHKELQDVLYISEQRYGTIKNQFGVPKKGDLLLTSVGSVGTPYLVNNNDKFYFKDGNLTWFKNFSKESMSKFLFYLLQAPNIKKQIINFSKGSSQSAITIETLKEIELGFPHIHTQERIVDILSSYDNLIENNSRCIKLLEKAARLIFREWFVFFHFPGHEGVKIINGIPNGWSKNVIKNYFNTKSGGTPNRKYSEFYQGHINWVKTQELNELYIFETEEKITEDAVKKSSAKIFPEDTLLISIYGNTNIGRTGILAKSSACNQACVAFFPKKKSFHYIYLQQYLKMIRDYLISISQGSAQTNISQDILCKVKILIPNEYIMTKFIEIVEPIYKKIKNLQLQNQKLNQARDLLLPKLVSGQIEV